MRLGLDMNAGNIHCKCRVYMRRMWLCTPRDNWEIYYHLCVIHLNILNMYTCIYTVYMYCAHHL